MKRWVPSESASTKLSAPPYIASVDEFAEGLIVPLFDGPKQKEWPFRLPKNVQNVSACQTAQGAVRTRHQFVWCLDDFELSLAVGGDVPDPVRLPAGRAGGLSWKGHDPLSMAFVDLVVGPLPTSSC